MNRLEIRLQRERLGLRQIDVAREMKMNIHTYRKKENGVSRFSDDQKFELAKILMFNLKQTNDFLFDGKFPIGELSESGW